jgi:glycerol uptake facilitator-like aquaporin
LLPQAAQGGDVRAQLKALTDVDVSSEALFIALILMMLMILGPLSQFLGALFNPLDVATLYASNKSSLSWCLMRTIAQTAGALSGAIAATTYFPTAWASRGHALVATVPLGIDGVVGASSEFILNYLVSLLVMVTQRSSRGRVIKYWTPLVATAAALKIGARYSGPQLNPAVAASWSYLYWNKGNSVLQHMLVFWAAPLAASILATFTDLGMQASASAGKKAARAKTD